MWVKTSAEALGYSQMRRWGTQQCRSDNDVLFSTSKLNFPSLSCRKVVHRNRHASVDQFLFHNLADRLPITPGQATPNTRHVHGGVQAAGFPRHFFKSLPNRFIAHRWNALDGAEVALPDKVGNPDIFGHLDELHFAQGKRLLLFASMPGAIALLRLGPTSGQGDHKAPPPPADVIADVHDDFRTRANRGGGIAGFVFDAHSPCCRPYLNALGAKGEHYSAPIQRAG
jgi:hypothetical protein